MALGQLQTVVDYAHYGKDRRDRGNAITGWGHILMITNLSSLVSVEASEAAQQLFTTWQTNWESLELSEPANRITDSINEARAAVLEEVKALD